MPKKTGVVTKKVPLKRLQRTVQSHGAVRSGSTTQVQQRAQQYSRDGYSGTMYYSSTTNMKMRENELLQAGTNRHNVQRKSGAQPKPGDVYTIKGKKSKK